MNILILDDIQHRHDVFRRIYAGHDVTSALRFQEFVRLLSERRWDLVHLDHDLGDFVADADTFVDGWGSTREYDGCHAADAICALPVEMRPTRVVIHSINGPGSARMLQALVRAGVSATREPFGEPGWSDE